MLEIRFLTATEANVDKKPGMATILDSNMAAILDYNTQELLDNRRKCFSCHTTYFYPLYNWAPNRPEANVEMKLQMAAIWIPIWPPRWFLAYPILYKAVIFARVLFSRISRARPSRKFPLQSCLFIVMTTSEKSRN